MDLNWKNDNFIQHKLSCGTANVSSVKYFKNWILTGSYDGTKRIWDIETLSLECLIVLDKPIPVILRRLRVRLLEFMT